MSKILFVYPNKEAYPIIPAGISIMSGLLKHSGHLTDIFDITFMVENKFSDNSAREKLKTVQKTDIEKYWGKPVKVDIHAELLKKVKSFKPDLIAFSIVENNYACARNMFAVIKSKFNIPIIVGGMFPTVAEHFFLEDKNVDIICSGEGENAIKELANRIEKRKDYSDIPNLIVKKKRGLIRNAPGPYYTWKPSILSDWDIFDNRHFMKPFMGKVWKTGYFELSRGCPFNCSYCNNHWYQKTFKPLGKYCRERPLEDAIKEMTHMKKKHSLELVWFHDENFCGTRKERLAKFCKEYKKQINLPFFIMTRADTILHEDILKMLKEAGCATISMGVETGNEKTRMETLNKSLKNSTYLKAFKNCRNHGIRTTANVMIGLPEESEEDILETINFCRQCNPDSIGIAIFVPYYGTKLRQVSIEKGLIEDKYYDTISFYYRSILKMPNISKEKFEKLYYNLNDLVFESNDSK